LVRAYCYLRSGNWRLKDVPLFFNKSVRAAQIGAESLFEKTFGKAGGSS